MASDEIETSEVRRFYDGKTIFITGATGFMGKVLVEKLLRSTNARKLYLLIRPKKGLETSARLEQLLSSKLFTKKKEAAPNYLQRVEAIHGDITLDNFGISPEDERKLTEEVNVVFHCAATIKFDEDLTKSVSLNVVSVFTILKLCKKMKKLQAVIHVSTAYCNTQYEYISEEIYSTNGDPLGVIDLCKRMDPSLLNSPEMTSQIIGNKPNTYTFTKALGESALVLEGGTLPIAVVRPSIVVAAWKEPIPGWVENLNGPTGIVAAAGKGVLRTVFCKRGKVADWVPVDVPINLSIVAAWKISTVPQNAIPVYNCTSGATNPITWGQLETLGLDAIRKYPMENMLWYPGGSYKESAVYNKICQILLHSLPAHLIDVGSLLLGKKQMMVKVVTKMHKAQAAIEYFAINEWKWSNDNVKKLNNELSDADKEIFNFDLSNLKWADFIDDYVKGTREFIFKEDPSSMEVSKQRMDRLYWVEKFCQMLLLLFSTKLISLLIF